jgi:hypothetical protein
MNGLINLPDAFPQSNAGPAPSHAPSPAPALSAIDQAGTAVLALSFVSGIVYMFATALQGGAGA